MTDGRRTVGPACGRMHERTEHHGEGRVEQQHCTRCGGPVDLDHSGPDAGYWVHARGSYRPWGEWHCLHFRCRVPGVDGGV